MENNKFICKDYGLLNDCKDCSITDHQWCEFWDNLHKEARAARIKNEKLRAIDAENKRIYLINRFGLPINTRVLTDDNYTFTFKYPYKNEYRQGSITYAQRMRRGFRGLDINEMFVNEGDILTSEVYERIKYRTLADKYQRLERLPPNDRTDAIVYNIKDLDLSACSKKETQDDAVSAMVKAIAQLDESTEQLKESIAKNKADLLKPTPAWENDNYRRNIIVEAMIMAFTIVVLAGMLYLSLGK